MKWNFAKLIGKLTHKKAKAVTPEDKTTVAKAPPAKPVKAKPVTTAMKSLHNATTGYAGPNRKERREAMRRNRKSPRSQQKHGSK